MTWAALLLGDPSPCLRWLVLTKLLGRSTSDEEATELFELRNEDALISSLFSSQAMDGSWGAGDLVGTPHNRLLTTSQVLLRMGFMGFDKTHPAIARAAAFIFRNQKPDGSWPLAESFAEDSSLGTYKMIPMQTAFPLRGLAACGFATDAQCEKAYDWLIDQRLDDGAWPTGIASETLGYVAGYRRLPHSRWGCRSNTTAALCALALHPERRSSEEAQRGLDLLLGRTSQEASNLGFETARIIGAEPFQGFLTYFARFDPGLVLWLCARIGGTTDDKRIFELVEFINNQQGRYGLWTYQDKPQASRWVSFDLLHSLSLLDKTKDWVSLEPPTPFKSEPFGKPKSRY